MLEVFYSAHCISCPEAQNVVRRFASSRADVMVVEHDVEVYLELATQYRLVATPAVVIDGKTVLYGVPNLATLAARVDASSTASATTSPAR